MVVLLYGPIFINFDIILPFLPQNPDLYQPLGENLLKTLCDKQKMALVSSFISCFPAMFSTLSKLKIIISAAHILSPANAFSFARLKFCHLVKA